MFMLATFNSERASAPPRGGESFWRAFLALYVASLIALSPSLAAEAANPSVVSSSEIRLEKALAEARKNYQSNPTNYDAAWKFARAAFEWADNTDNQDHTSVANEGIEAAHAAITLKPSGAEGHYYLALNVGQIARTKSLSALRMVKQMEQEFKKSIEIDPGLDFAGACRSLGMLYTDVPGWPVSIGNKSKGRELLQKAVQLYPEFPDNQITLAEAYRKAGDFKTLRQKLDGMEKQIELARKQLSGELWAQSWSDWNKRWREVKQGLQSSDR